jgi:hypothetical protein
VTTTLVDKWNRSAWAVVASPNVSASVNLLEGESCATTTFCMAVGGSSVTSYYKTLTVRGF